jgi:hypothetical protein
MPKSKKNMCGGGRRRRRRGKRGREEAAMHTIRDGEHILGNIGDFVKFVVAVSERIANNNVLPHRRLEKTLPATANNSDGKKGLIFLTYLFKVPDFNEALEIIVNNVFLLSQENKVTSSSGGSRNRRQRRGRRRKGGAMPILGSVVSAVGILMMWFGNGQRQKDADKFLEDTIEKFRKITGLNMRNLVYYIQQQKKFSQIYPPLREHCAQGGANDFSTTYSPPSTALVPVSNTGSPDWGTIPSAALVPTADPHTHTYTDDWGPGSANIDQISLSADAEPMPFFRNGKLMTCEEIVEEKDVEGAGQEITAFEIIKMFSVDSIYTLQDIKSVLEYAARKKSVELVGEAPRTPDTYLDWLGSLFGFASSSGTQLQAASAYVTTALKVGASQSEIVAQNFILLTANFNMALARITAWTTWTYYGGQLFVTGATMIIGGPAFRAASAYWGWQILGPAAGPLLVDAHAIPDIRGAAAQLLASVPAAAAAALSNATMHTALTGGKRTCRRRRRKHTKKTYRTKRRKKHRKCKRTRRRRKSIRRRRK